jgi:hypothetical protein
VSHGRRELRESDPRGDDVTAFDHCVLASFVVGALAPCVLAIATLIAL